MIDFSNEHPEVVRLMAEWMYKQNLIITKDNDRLRKLVALQEASEQLGLAGIADQLLVFRKLIFGRGSEKRAGSRPRDADEADLLVFSQSLLPPLKEKEAEKLPESAVTHDFTAAELMEESVARALTSPSPEQWEEIPGFYDESTLITLIEREYRLEKHRRKKWRLKTEYNTAGKDVIITAPGPAKLIPGCTYSIDFAASVVADKYISHMPLERQKREMGSLGLKKIHTKTLYNLCMAVGVHLEPVAEKIRKDILESGLCIHCDETPWPIQVKEQDDGYMWIIANRAGSFYSFEPTRSGKVIAKTLEGYRGPALADGYIGYNRLKAMEGITLANCWAHARRKFTDIEENYPQETKEILDIIDDLFKIERKAKTFAELEKLRATESKKIVAAIKEWLIRPHEATRSRNHLEGAINYCLNQWQGLTLFLEDVRVPLTNNEAERTIRHAVMGRKNFYGSRTHNGADTAATLYTIVESCKKVELDPRTYINMAVKLSAAGKSVPTPLEHARIIRAN